MPNVIVARDFVEASDILTTIIGEKNRQVVYDIWDELVDATPVCSGLAAYSWYVSPGIPFSRKIPEDELPKMPDFSLGDQCERFFEDPRLEGRYSSDPLFSEYSRNYTKWFINNIAPYIDELNGGSSNKAPAGFVEIAIDKALSKHR